MVTNRKFNKGIKIKVQIDQSIRVGLGKQEQYWIVLFDIFINCGRSSRHFMPVLAGEK
jgi:hypothetical protein